MAQEEMVAYIDALKQKAKIKILKPVVITPTSSAGKNAEGGEKN
jgi:peptidyl-prolyl cis-trans isomerase D